jgi:hypothetical protein
MFDSFQTLQSKSPPAVARALRRVAVRPRYYWQMMKARRGYREHGSDYPFSCLFVAGLPKSGTSWLESMLASFPGYARVMIPEAIAYERKHGGTHDFDVPTDLFERFDRRLAVLKLHARGADRNVQLLDEAGLPYVIMYRDLRDVAVSYFFYVKRTRWHPDHLAYHGLDVEEGLLRFGRTLLPEYVTWIRQWRSQRDPDRSMIVRYEDLLKDTKSVFWAVTDLYNLNAEHSEISKIVDAHRFDRMSGGRDRGNQDTSSFLRKGVSGDWKQHFTPPVTQLFKEKAGEALVNFGYEDDATW